MTRPRSRTSRARGPRTSPRQTPAPAAAVRACASCLAVGKVHGEEFEHGFLPGGCALHSWLGFFGYRSWVKDLQCVHAYPYGSGSMHVAQVHGMVHVTVKFV